MLSLSFLLAVYALLSAAAYCPATHIYAFFRLKYTSYLLYIIKIYKSLLNLIKNNKKIIVKDNKL